MLSTMRRGAGSAFAIRVAGFGLAYLLQILLARWMGASEYGSYAYAVSWGQFLAVFAGVGMQTTLLRYVPQYLAQEDYARLHGILRRSRMWVGVAGLGVATLATIIYAGSGALSGFPPDAIALMLGFWIAPLLAFTNLHMSVFRAMRRIVLALAPAELLRHVLTLVGLTLFLVYTGREISSVVAVGIVIASFLVVLLIQHGFLRTQIPDVVWRTPSQYESREWLHVSFHLLLVAGFNIVIARSDVLMVGIFMTDADVGLFNATSRTANLGSFVLLAINTIAAPLFASLYAQQDKFALRRLVRNIAHLSFWPSLAGFLSLIFLADPILSLFGKDFIVMREELLILAGGHLVSAGCGLVGSILNVTGHHGVSARVYGYSAAVNIILNVVLIPLYGVLGAAVATTVTMIFWNVWLSMLVVKRLGIHASIIGALLQK